MADLDVFNAIRSFLLNILLLAMIIILLTDTSLTTCLAGDALFWFIVITLVFVGFLVLVTGVSILVEFVIDGCCASCPTGRKVKLCEHKDNFFFNCLGHLPSPSGRM